MASDLGDDTLPRATLYPPSCSSGSPHTPSAPRFPLPAAAPATLDTTDEDTRPSKRQKTQACLRCRRRKQKCDDRKPCSNCVRADEPCHAAPSVHPRHAPDGDTLTTRRRSPNSPTRIADIAALEQVISRIERRSSRPDRRTQGDLGGQQPRNAEPPGSQGGGSSVSDLEGVLSLSRSTPAMALLASFAAPTADQGLPLERQGTSTAARSLSDVEKKIDHEMEQSLFDIYEDKVQWRYPFLRMHHLRNRSQQTPEPCTAFFLNMIYSISLLLEKNNLSNMTGLKQDDFYRVAVTRYLSHVFSQSDRLLHIQAYLILAMHALYSPSTERIITITSAAVRYCVMSQLHCAAAEPQPSDPVSRIRIQLRRRVFWCAYKLDRTVGGIYHLPFSIPDSQITVKLYANINDVDLEERCSDDFPDDAPGISRFTDVSAALHVVYCRQIQSEILNSTLHRDFSECLDHNDRWRQRVLNKLDRWRSLWDRYSGLPSEKLARNDWINMMYSYSLGMLYQPTKTSVLSSAGPWTVQACVQACLIFRKLMRDSVNQELWLGLITQFKCGVALLYTFFATPPQARPPVYEHADVPEAVRACSITLTLIAEHWPQSKCIRDTFDILAREVPLYEPPTARTPPTTKRIRDESRETLLSLLEQLELVVIHRDTLRMIREIATENFPYYGQVLGAQSIIQDPASLNDGLVSAPPEDIYQASTQHLDLVEDFFQPLTPYRLHMDSNMVDQGDLEETSIEFPTYFDNLDYF